MTETKPLIHKDMVVGDIVGLYPDVADIIMNYGLHCIGCHYNAIETLEQGILGHGYSEEELNQLLVELNEHVSKSSGASESSEWSPEAEDLKIHVTPKALKKIKSVMKQEKKTGMALRLEVTGAAVFKYALNFVDLKERRDSEKLFSFARGTVQALADKRDYKKMNDLTIDYVTEDNREGFKMKNPNVSNG